MCNLLFPVFRIGKIIQRDTLDGLPSGDAKSVAKLLYENSLSITNEIVTIINNSPELQLDNESLKAEVLSSQIGAARIRFDPTVVVDLNVLKIKIGGAEIESRFCITVCEKTRKSKCWQRFNLVKDTTFMRSNFFEWAEKLNKILFPKLIKYYSDTLTSITKKSETLESVYSIEIKCGGVNNMVLDDAFHSEFGGDDFGCDNANMNNNFLLSQFRELEPELEKLPDKAGIHDGPSSEQLIGFSVVRSLSHNLDLLAKDELNAIVALTFDNEKANFICVGYDNSDSLGSAHHRSFSHIVSGEISSEYGRLF